MLYNGWALSSFRHKEAFQCHQVYVCIPQKQSSSAKKQHAIQ